MISRTTVRDCAKDKPLESDERYRLLFDRNIAGVYVLDLDGKYLNCNESFARMLGYDSVEEFWNRSDADSSMNAVERANVILGTKEQGSLRNVEIRLRRRDGTPIWVLNNAHLIPGEPGSPPLVQGTIIDITPFRQAQDRVSHLNRLYSVLSHVNQAIVRGLDRAELLKEVCRIAVEDGQFRMAWFGLIDAPTGEVRPVASHGFDEGYLNSIRISVGENPEGRGPTGNALRQGRYFVCNDIDTDPCMAPWRERALERGYRASSAFPIRVAGRLIGAFMIYASETGFFNQQEVSLLEEVANDVSFALEKIESEAERSRIQREHTVLAASEAAARTQVKAESRFRQLLEAAPDAIVEVDMDGRIEILNAAAEALFGYSRDELIGQSVEVLVPERFRAAHQGFRMGCLHQPKGRMENLDLSARRSDGTEFPVEISLSPIQTDHEHAVTCIIRDTTQRKAAETALQESNRRINRILESITDGFFALDKEWRITYWNGKAEQIIARKRDDVIGKNFWKEFPDLIGSVFYKKYRKALAERTPVEFETYFEALKLWADFHVYPSEDGLSVFFRDITRRKILEQQLLQSQKMEAVGRLAGGVAHDFNNLLTIIGGYGQMVFEHLESNNPVRRDIEAILEAANRASTLTKQLLAFSRRQIVQPKVLDLNRLISKLGRMLRPVIGEDVDLQFVLASDLGRIKADPGQIEQVMMNLAVNARDAMPKGGRLTIETADVEFGEDDSCAEPRMRSGRFVLLTVSDNGTGMDAEVKNHLFEPFFTTKGRGKGTGLGLSTVYGIVKQFGGEIIVDSELGSGSTFRIFFPRVEETSSPVADSGTPRGFPAGTETILLVEDEAGLRKLAREMLARQGYKVIDACCGAEAIAFWEKEPPDSINLLLTDVIMPQMTGKELADHLTALQPNLKVLFMSGYTNEVIARHGVLDTGIAFLQKPFTSEALGRKVRRVLDIDRIKKP